MPACLSCLGDGHLDFRDDDAQLLEHFTREHLEARGCVLDLGIVECDECEGTGVISPERYADLMACARAHVDQTMAYVLSSRGGNE